MRRLYMVQDNGFMDYEDETFDIDLPEGSSIKKVVLEYLRTKEDHGKKDIKSVKKHMKSGGWNGGEWSKENKHTLQFISDVCSTEYSI